MYQYSVSDQTQIDNRVIEFRDQTSRYLQGSLSEDQFRPLRLMNGLYEERYAPMLRVAIPYGELNSTQLRKLAAVSRKYDKGYGHITTRQNIQFNWLQIGQVPDLLEELSQVQMHAIQTSGNCIRNITTDPLAGIITDEVEDPRPWCEIIRQWATLHPEFLYLPRKFKIAVTGAATDRAAILAHDIGLRLVPGSDGEIGFQVYVGGGLGRTPVVGKPLKEFLPKRDLLLYLEAILRIYNLLGRRDNKYKARIKILVNSMGIVKFRNLVEEKFSEIENSDLRLTKQHIAEIKRRFKNPVLDSMIHFSDKHTDIDVAADSAPEEYIRWKTHNVIHSKFAQFRSVHISLKNLKTAPGDITALEMEAIAKIADRYTGGIVRTTHNQNLLLPLVHHSRLYELWAELHAVKKSDSNINTVQDIICCPGMEFCSLANTTSIPIALEIQQRFTDPVEIQTLGNIQIKISGCMNACGHHHIGHIGILGVDKKGEQWFQLTLGGRSDENLQLGERLGPAVDRHHIANAVELIIRHYMSIRENSRETFLQTISRVGIDPFKRVVYEKL